jgi:hypothetical protein
MKYTHKGSIVFYSLATGLPLRMTAKCWLMDSHESNVTVEWHCAFSPHKRVLGFDSKCVLAVCAKASRSLLVALAGPLVRGTLVADHPFDVGVIYDDRPNDNAKRKRRLVEHEAACKDLQAFLFGPDNDQLLTLRELVKDFLDVVFITGPRGFDIIVS